MMGKMDKLFSKKKKEDKEMSAPEKKAKSSVLETLRDYASEQMGKKLGGLKKVTVASDSEEGLEKGLEKAKQILGDKEHEEMVEDAESGPDNGEDLFSGGEEESEESDEEMDEDALDRKIAELMKLKEQMKK